MIIIKCPKCKLCNFNLVNNCIHCGYEFLMEDLYRMYPKMKKKNDECRYNLLSMFLGKDISNRIKNAIDGK